MVEECTDVTKIDIPPSSLWRRFCDAIFSNDPGPKSVTTEIQARGYGVSFRLKRTYHTLDGEK
jgi:hypothetical protein